MKKAVILTTARSGSNYLLGMLESHPGFYFHGEIFHPEKANGLRGQKAMRRITGEDPTALRNRDPLAFLDTVFRMAPAKAQVVGFKLFINHSDKVLRHIAADSSYKVILLERKNRLAVFSSAAIGRATGVWRQAKGEAQDDAASGPPLKVTFDPDAFDRYRAWADKMFAKARRLLAHRDDVSDVTYDEIRNPAAIAAIVGSMDLLGGYMLKENTEKQNPGPLLDRFLNPKQVVEYLERHGLTQWLTE